MGTLLILLTVGVLWFDRAFAPWYPCLFLLVAFLSLLGCFEFLTLLGSRRPRALVCYLGLLLILIANWPAHFPEVAGTLGGDPWTWVLAAFVAVVIAAFLVEMALYQQPEAEATATGEVVARIAFTVLLAAYLGLLPCFLVQLRWPTTARAVDADVQGAVGLALAIFIPKCCDIGAYFTGRFLGSHKMTPVLSPKKTWEGLAGGLATAVLCAVGINALGPVLPGGLLGACAFGLTLGLAGVLGDLAESLIKRDCRQKDASQIMPGFGGVLDVVDAILFAAPVAYWWLR
jgi:phosphatidate cytidylyltransferase